MFYKDLYFNICNACKIKSVDFYENKNNCVNVLLSKLYMYEDVAFYGYDIGYLTNEQYSKISAILFTNIQKCQNLLLLY